MKVKVTQNTEIKDKFYFAEQKVLAYGIYKEASKTILIVNSELKIINPFAQNLIVTIINNDLTDYENHPEFNYGKEFYIQKDFLKIVKHLKSYIDFQADSLWLKSKLKPFYSDNIYGFSTYFRNTVLNENYKLALINGFLIFANHYINVNNNKSSYSNCFYINTTDDLDSIVPERFKEEYYSFQQIDIENYNETFVEFISERLSNGNEKTKEENIRLCRQLFELIDSIFIEQLEEVYRITTFYDNMIVIKYKNKFYYLNYDWNSYK